MQTAYTGAPGFWSSFGLPSAASSGETLTPDRAFGIGVIYACIKKISETIASLPIYLYRDEVGNFDRVEYYSDYILNKTPDDVCTAYEFRESLIALSLLYGKGWARIYRNRNGEAERIKLIHPMLVSEKMIDGVLMVVIKTGDGEDVVPYADMICVKQILGASPINMNSETVSLLYSAQKYAGKFFNGGGVMNGILSSPENLKQEQIDVLLETLDKQSGKQTQFLPFGVKYEKIGVDPDKAQSVDARKFNGEEICRIYNVPPAMVGLAQSGYKDYENQAKAFVTGTIAPICERVEGELLLKLVPRSLRMDRTYRHDMDELMRGDSAGRANYYREALQNGWMSSNEVRNKERMNPVEGGDIITKQVNQIPLTQLQAYGEKISTDAGAQG